MASTQTPPTELANASVETDPAELRYPLVLFGAEQTKTVTFIRHGEGFHNVAGAADHEQYKNEEWFDAHLTKEGWRQAEALSVHIKACGLQVDVVVVSPLNRALETAVGAFARSASVDGGDGGMASNGNSDSADGGSGGVGTGVLMAARDGAGGHRVARGAAARADAPPFVVHEGCREIIGVHPCDRRRDTAVTSALFPGAHWSLVTDPVDTLWHPDVRETREEITARAREFMLHIMQRPERHIAIVTHSSFLNYLCKSFGADFSTHMQDGLHKWYENCEMRTYVLADTVHAPPRGPLHFHGGKACAASVAAAPA